MASESTGPIERWTAKRRMALVVNILKGETSVAEVACQHGLTVAEVEDWRQKFLVGAENALRSRPKDEEAIKVLYLGLQRIAKNWTAPIPEWKRALNQFAMIVGDRVPTRDYPQSVTQKT